MRARCAAQSPLFIPAARSIWFGKSKEPKNGSTSPKTQIQGLATRIPGNGPSHGFVRRCAYWFGESELDEFEGLLGVPDWEVYAWLIGQKPVPETHRGPVLDQLIAFRYAAQGG